MASYLPLGLALVLRLASPTTADLSYIVLAAYALLGRPHLLRALVFSWLFTMINPGIAPDASLAAVGRYAVLFAAALSALVQSNLSRGRRMTSLERLTLLLGLFILLHSTVFSPIADVSVLKAVSWTLAMAAILSAWCGMTPLQHHRLSEELFWGLAMLLLVSLPMAVTSIGYLTNGTGFQGILNQPQALGPTVALLCVWTLARGLAEPRPQWWLLGLAGVSMVTVVMTEARTAGLAAVLGIGLALVLGPALAGRPILSLAPGMRSARVWGVLIATGVVVLFTAAMFSDLVAHFLTKSGRSSAEGLWSAYEMARGRVVEAMLNNIVQQPWTGVGFGIASDPAAMIVSRDPLLGLPLGAAVEKGATPLMVVEELGIPGAALVALWVLRLISTAAGAGLAALAVVLTVLLLNLGEATLFSPGGFGLLPLVLLGCAYSSGLYRRPSRHG